MATNPLKPVYREANDISKNPSRKVRAPLYAEKMQSDEEISLRALKIANIPFRHKGERM